MLIQFEVENYRSIKEHVAFQMAAVNYYKEGPASLIDPELPGLAKMKFLRVAALYGPNASGKTTLFKAMQDMKRAVLGSAKKQPNDRLPHQPFRLDSTSKDNPTRYSVAFTSDDVRYEYSFAYTSTRIEEEELCSFPKGYKQLWFSRRGSELKDSEYLRVPASLRPLLNDNMLLLSLLANYPKLANAKKIAPVYKWFEDDFVLLDRGPNSDSDYPYSGEIIDHEKGTDFQRSFILDMLRHADFGIDSARVELKELPSEIAEAIKRVAEALGPEIAESVPEATKEVVFEHVAGGEHYSFPMGYESDGTMQLFGLSGYVAKVLENGQTLVVDELDKSLHPILVEEVVRCFLDPELNAKGAQLVFTAHNPCVLEGDLLRRDQVWFTEKDSEGVTSLYPLSDYSPRKSESIATGYLVGRYSAVPVIPKCFGLCERNAGVDVNA